MALNFSLLDTNAPANIANSVSQGQQIGQQEKMNQMRMETSQFDLDKVKREAAGLQRMQQLFMENGKSPDMRTNFTEMVKSGVPHFMDIGYNGLRALDEQDKFQSIAGKLYPELFGRPSTPSAPSAPSVPSAPSAAPIAGSFAADVAERRGAAPVNAMVPAPAAPVNALAQPQAKTPDQLRQELMLFSQSTDPRAKAFAEILKAQLTESLKAHVVGPNSNLIIGGKSVYAGAPAPTEISRLQAERASLLQAGVPETDPRIQAYDQKLASGESQSTKLQRELQNAIANKAAPAVIAQLQRDIRNLHPGLAMQNVTGVDSQGNQIVTRFAGAGGGPQGQFALNQAPTGTARAMLGLTEADSALLFGPGGPVELGQIPVGKLNASNAKMYVAAIKANPTLNLASLTEDQLLQASKAKAQGNIQGKQVLTLADRATAKNIAEGNIPPLTGPNSTRIMNEVIAMKPDYSARDYNLQTSAVKAFNQGIQGNKVRSLNVVMEHFNTLEKAADALQSGDVRAINAVSQYIQTQTGKPAPGNFNAVKEILADEIVASVVPGVGALADRQAIKKTILASSSPEQLKGIVANYKELIGGQLNGLETQYKAGTGRSDFKARYLTPAAVQGLTPSAGAAGGGGGGAVDTSNPYLK
jgi:hypothetical protein